jgi:O-Antigen ligase
MTVPPSAAVSDGSAPGRERSPATPRFVPLSPGWPLTALLVLYPVWWLLGLGTLILFVLAVPMVVHLVRNRPVAVPRGFGIWVLFLVWVVASTFMLGMDPPGVLAESASSRIIPVAYYLAGYLAATIILLYAGNLTEAEYPRRRLVRHLGGFFAVVVVGGLLGILVPAFDLTSPVERLLPGWMASNGFVQSLVHPVSAQLHDVLGYEAPRPAAPFGYTNIWGNCLALLLGWFVVSWFRGTSPRRRLVGAGILGLAAIPVVYSLNRGLWISLGLALVFMAVRLAARGRLVALGALVVALTLAAVVVMATPLSGIVQGRLDNPHSNDIRTFTTVKTLEVIEHSPVLGLGATRSALGSAKSIAVGESPDCPNCGNPILGSNGQLWLVLISQGYGGVILFVGFFAYCGWVYRRDQSAVGDAGLLALGLSLFFMFIYNAVAIPLVISFLSIALLWRNQRDGATDAVPALRRAAYPLVERPA